MTGPEEPPGNYVLTALRRFGSYGEAEAIVAGGERRSYASLARSVLRLAAILYGQGVRAGDGVAVLALDTPDSATLHLALHLIGCRTIWIATYAPVREQVEFARLARPDVLIYTVTPRREKILAEVVQQTGPVRILALGPDGQGPDLLAALATGTATLDPVLAGPEPESLFYTGGTTGVPKLVRHGQRFYHALLDIAEYYLMIGEPPMRFLVGASFTHVSGQMPAFLTLFEGGTLFLDEDEEAAQMLATIEAERISSTFLTPAQLYELTEQARRTPRDVSSLRYLNVGGAAAAPARLAEAIDCFGSVIRLVYGCSEAPLITDLPFLERDPEHPDRLSSCGLPFADTQIEIRDSEGRSVPVGEAGEVWVSGSLLMAGYWQQPGLTSQALAGGWLRTGDIGRLDGDGYLFLVDRSSDMIVTGDAAANVYARPIEDVLTAQPGVRAAAVVGVPGPDRTELVHAVVVAGPGAALTAGGLRAAVRAELNELYTPHSVAFVPELPLTSLGKVDKRALRQRFLAGPDAPPGREP